jgi:cytoskeletal protein RodZ
MGSAKRTNQGGSILVYIIIGAVLAAAVVGTIFFVRQRSGQVQRQTPLFTAPAIAPESQSNTSDDSSSSKNNQKSDQTTPTPTPAPAAPSPNASTQPKQVPQTGGTLPHTGPAETAASFAVLALLTGTAVAYVQSRRSFALQRN